MLLFNIPFLDGTMAWTYYVRRNAGFFGHLKERQEFVNDG